MKIYTKTGMVEIQDYKEILELQNPIQELLLMEQLMRQMLQLVVVLTNTLDDDI